MAWNNLTIFVKYEAGLLESVGAPSQIIKLVSAVWTIYAGLQIFSIIMIIIGVKKLQKEKPDVEFQELKDKVERLEKDKEKDD